MIKINKILLLDDSIAVNALNKKLLESTNAFKEILTYTNPVEVLNLLENSYNESNLDALPEIIFLDVEMPEMDAFTFLTRYGKIDSIVKSQFKPLIVIISDHLLVNNNFDMLKQYGIYGVVDQIVKPIDSEDIQEILEMYDQKSEY